MTKDLELLNQIAAGGAFDQTTAVRALARVVTAGCNQQANAGRHHGRTRSSGSGTGRNCRQAPQGQAGSHGLSRRYLVKRAVSGQLKAARSGRAVSPAPPGNGNKLVTEELVGN